MTVAHRNDIQRAMSEAVEAASRGAGARGQLTQQSLPPIRLQVVKVASEVRRPFLCLNWRCLVCSCCCASGAWAGWRASGTAGDRLSIAAQERNTRAPGLGNAGQAGPHGRAGSWRRPLLYQLTASLWVYPLTSTLPG